MRAQLSGLFVVLPLLCLTACGPSEPVAPVTVVPDVAFAWSVGETTAYSGNLQPGVFVVCTSKFSPAGSYTYLVDADPTTEKFVKSVEMSPGECRVVAEAKKRGSKTDSHVVSVSAVSNSFIPDGYVLLNSACVFNCDHPGLLSSAVLDGEDGAIAKFYFRVSVLGAGGHGGTGTLNWNLD